ncbi:n-acyl homoserine lactonase [Fusarium subglutinans]|uniref:N-acyl homoserine lactonase n=1 Tax=Gibberella subglutinans TaxID=42677 RepID=A0A8H5Q6B3_GIBSU|nr:n-acyl homoserine lactonase [Fusarium subglutinans]KAF5608286.1 n-acyl homoserine lactonase [Fusarium subglutinans]
MTPCPLPPPVDIPNSPNTVEVYIIDTTSFMSGFPASTFVEPLVPGFDTINVGSYSFLIKHPGPNTKYDTMVFDLGVRKDWEILPETFVAGIKGSGWFKSNMIPAYPTVRDSHVNETAWEGRDLVEIDFKGEKSL